jgi:hypothetical protein
MMQEINKAAVMYNKTKDPYYKNLWYQLVEEFTSGFNNTQRWPISSSSSD